MAKAASTLYPKPCYNCGKELILDFYWIVVNKHCHDIQYLGVDFDHNITKDDPDWEEIEFEVCKHCYAAQ